MEGTGQDRKKAAFQGIPPEGTDFSACADGVFEVVSYLEADGKACSRAGGVQLKKLEEEEQYAALSGKNG